jgi:hypothetical protein
MYVACEVICSPMNFAAAGAANMYEARNLGDVRCEVTESTIPAAGKSKRYRPETFLDASFEDLDV